jgi:RNA polymerase sigma-70 factor (ECF subfamily)
VPEAKHQADPQLIRELFLAHASFVWRVLRRFGVPESDVEDVCQEVFVVVHRRLPEFEGRASVRTWIYEIARRSALAQRRRAGQRSEQAALLDELQDSAPGPELSTEHRHALAWLEQGLARLDADKREAFVLYELEELTLAEVSLALGCPINTVHNRVKSAREALRSWNARAEGVARARQNTPLLTKVTP